jgi:hypothetical protein
VTEIDLAETTIELDGKPVRITKADADALARALIERIPQSQLPPGAREMLLAITFSHGFIEGEGDVRIGPWVLTEFLSSGWGLLLRFSPDDPARYTGYFAPVTRGEAGLQVGEVQPVIFHPPRHPQR